jgi:hypothetical protein
MKPTELRIKNLVNINELTRIDNTNELPLINPLFKIERIDEDGEIIIYSEINNLHIHCDLESIQPIPLTEEWLLNFGFKKIGVNFQLKSFCLWYSSSEICYVWRFMNVWEIEGRKVCLNNVHQLQNFWFALTGEELTFKQQEQ